MGSIAASPSLGLILILSHAHASGFILSSEHTKSCPYPPISPSPLPLSSSPKERPAN
jgi:hypothetical protein